MQILKEYPEKLPWHIHDKLFGTLVENVGGLLISDIHESINPLYQLCHRSDGSVNLTKKI